MSTPGHTRQTIPVALMAEPTDGRDLAPRHLAVTHSETISTLTEMSVVRTVGTSLENTATATTAAPFPLALEVAARGSHQEEGVVPREIDHRLEVEVEGEAVMTTPRPYRLSRASWV